MWFKKLKYYVCKGPKTPPEVKVKIAYNDRGKSLKVQMYKDGKRQPFLHHGYTVELRAGDSIDFTTEKFPLVYTMIVNEGLNITWETKPKPIPITSDTIFNWM